MTTPARAPDVVVWAVNSLGGQIVRTAKSDTTISRNLIHHHRRLDQANPNISRVDNTLNSRGFGLWSKSWFYQRRDWDNRRNQGSAENCLVRWRRHAGCGFQAVNRVFALTLSPDNRPCSFFVRSADAAKRDGIRKMSLLDRRHVRVR